MLEMACRTTLHQTLDADIHRLLCYVRSCGSILVISQFPAEWKAQVGDLPILTCTEEERAVINKKGEDCRSIMEVLGSMLAVKKVVQLVAEHPDELSHMIPCIYDRLSKLETRLQGVYSYLKNPTDVEIWAGVKDKMSAEHEVIASAVVTQMLETIKRLTIEDMCQCSSPAKTKRQKTWRKTNVPVVSH